MGREEMKIYVRTREEKRGEKRGERRGKEK